MTRPNFDFSLTPRVNSPRRSRLTRTLALGPLLWVALGCGNGSGEPQNANPAVTTETTGTMTGPVVPTPPLLPMPAATPTGPASNAPIERPIPSAVVSMTSAPVPVSTEPPAAAPVPVDPPVATSSAPLTPPTPTPSPSSGSDMDPMATGGTGGMPPLDPEPPLPGSDCVSGTKDGNEAGVDCGGDCPNACLAYVLDKPNPENENRSGCEPNGNGFMCPRSMLLSPEMKQAAFDDWGGDEAPFTYGVVGHDPDPGGVDDQSASYSSTCCQCYQLVYKGPRDGGVSVPAPKPLIVQAFNTYAGGPSAFDVYMAVGGHGNFNGCTENGGLYSGYPDTGGDWSGGARATRYSQCGGDMGYTQETLAAPMCQDYVASECAKIQTAEAYQSTAQQSCIESNRPDSHYHMNWNVVVKRVECPEALTRVTGCQLGDQGLPDADPAIQTVEQAMQNGFKDADYHTTTMEDCCRPTCAWPTNVSGTTDGWSRFYTCDGDGEID
jgi:hypothetical protein